MNNIKKLFALLLAVVMVMSMAACNPSVDPSGSVDGTNPSADGQTAAYTVEIKTEGQLPVEGVSVEVYQDNTMKELVNVATTNADGKATLNMPVSDKYAVKLSNVKNGYQTLESYSLTGGTTSIILKTALIQDASMSGASFKIGDVMYDFEITEFDGTTHKLSDMLAEKEMVLLNIFYTTCGPCNNEMPYMFEAYQKYQDKVGVMAISPYGDDNAARVQAFKDQYGLTFPVAKVPNGWNTLAQDGYYPTTYIIDRYGVVCLVEVGGLTSARPFNSIFEHFTAKNYKTELIGKLDDIIVKQRPTFEDMTPEQIATLLGNGDGSINYRNEVEDEYCWPFIETEREGEVVLKASNSGIEAGYAILYADVTLKKGQAVGFDYLISSETAADYFHVIVDETPIYNMSGVDETPTWKACYPWVAPKDGTYQIGLTYLKDDSDNVGDDTVYLKNMRIIDASEIDIPSFIPMEAAVSSDGFSYEYVDVFYNDQDGYYHVGSEDGPYLLANLLSTSQFNEETALYSMALDGAFGDTMADRITSYASYASNSKMTAYCTVNARLAELLKECVDIAGFEDNDSEWLKLCKYYAAYGTNGLQMEDPIAGLATFSALPAQEGMNEIPYLEGIPIMPRGKLAEFIPTRSGVYRITSHDNGTVEDAFLSAWIFDETHTVIYEALADGRFYTTDNFNPNIDITMVYYMEAGKSYFIDIAYWDPYTVGTIPFSIEYVGGTYQDLRLCSPGPFTYIEMPDGGMGETIHGGIHAVLNPADGLYHQDLGKDTNGNQIYGSVIYAEFSGSTGIINQSILTMIEMGAFDAAKTEDDMTILQYMKLYDNDEDKVRNALLEHWGTDIYNENQALGIIDDVFEGIYHGRGHDETDIIKSYVNKMIVGGELDGCVAVDEALANVLQTLMDKYTFEGVDQSWLKLCYYYTILGA